MMKLKNNEFGFSLIEVLVVMSIMGAFVIGFMRLSDRMLESEKRMMDLMAMNDLVSEVRYTLNDSKACTASFSFIEEEGRYLFPTNLEKIVNRRNRTIVEAGKNVGRIRIKAIRVNLEEVPANHITEEPLMAQVFLDVEGRAKLTRNKVFKISVPVLVGRAAQSSKIFFNYCDSLSAGVAQEMANQIVKRMCASFSLPYDEVTGQCEFHNMNTNAPMLNGDMFKKIQNMLKEQLPSN